MVYMTFSMKIWKRMAWEKNSEQNKCLPEIIPPMSSAVYIQ